MDVMQATPRDRWRSKRDSMTTAAALCAVALTSAMLAGCTASGEDVRPPQDQLFFPSGIAVGNVGNTARVLFVANSNSELRYDSGSISVLDLDIVGSTIDAWRTSRATGPCEQDPDHRETLTCDEAMFFNKAAGVRIGNFATDIAVQNFSAQDGNTHLRVIVPTRGDPSISWADYDGNKLTCASGTTAFAECDDAHRLSSVRNDPAGAAILDEPFGVFADATNGFAMITHLSRGAVTLIDAPRDGRVQISDAIANVFASDQNVDGGATGVAGRTPTSPGNIVYVGSRTENRIQTFTVTRPINDAAPYLLPGNFFLLSVVGNNAGGSTDTRGLSFSPGGDRLYIVNRRPPSLQIYDTSLGPSGAPRNTPTGASDICRQASTVTVLDTGDGERAYVTCFQDGAIYIIDPRGQSQVEDILTVGRGPYAVAADAGRKLLFISNFLEDTIAVVDIDPQSATRNRVVLRIGEPREL
jgi:hypothetical protein